MVDPCGHFVVPSFMLFVAKVVCFVACLCAFERALYAYPHEFDSLNRSQIIEGIRQYRANGLIVEPYYRWTAAVVEDLADRDMRIYTFLLFSENKLPMPDQGDQAVSLLVKGRKKPNGFLVEYEAYVNWKQPVGNGVVDVVTELDGLRKEDKWVRSKNKEATFPPDPEAFVEDLKFAETFSISVTPQGHETPLTAIFDVRGLSKMMRIM